MAAKRGGGTGGNPAWRPVGHPDIRKAGGRVKRTFVLSADLDVRISVLARTRGLDRSELVERILAEATRGVTVWVRGEGEGQGQAAAPAQGNAPGSPTDSRGGASAA